ncbi:hypothetical protein DB346_01260 [Verrucomicrobia bacterium LW23]|nr:hypothetical protein DB346_01260 [Verrucomicrobia bacterium LW23]
MRLRDVKDSSFVRLLLGHPLYWACQALVWGCVLMTNIIHVLTDPLSAPLANPYSLVFFACLAGSTHLYRIFIHLAGWKKLKWRELLPRVLIAAIVIAAVQAVAIAMIVPPEMFSPAHRPQIQLSLGWHILLITCGNFIFIMAWSVAYFGYHLHEDYQQIQMNQLRLQAALREAEHRALSAQINPHFLFNSLNTLRSLILENPEKARDSVTELACLFRSSLQTSRHNLITLREEMETVRSYLSLEKARFESRLIISDDVPEETLNAKLPPFLLQTLIENAIKYGVGKRRCAEISYRASLGADGLTLEVTNPGKIEEPLISATGIGLSNSRLRLELLFGSRAFLHLKSVPEGVVSAEALIPQMEVSL